MKIVKARAFGEPDVLELVDQPNPAVGAGQALIQVAYAPALFLDTQIRAGRARAWFPTVPPYVPGRGVAGVVGHVGDIADRAWLGRRVLADTPDSGGYAERVVVDVDALIAVPDGVELADAAALLHDGRTALKLIEITRPRQGERVLVLGAAGGLGTIVVQLARDAGCEVIGAVSGQERKRALVRELGAYPVDYTRPNWIDVVREITDGAGVEVILDGIGGPIGGQAFELAAPGARFFAYGTPGGGFAQIDADRATRRAVTVSGIEQVQLAPAEARRLVAQALGLDAVGHFRPVVGQTFPLQDAAEAHRAIESRQVIGKTLLEV